MIRFAALLLVLPLTLTADEPGELLTQGKFLEALKASQDALRASPTDARLHGMIAYCQLELGNSEHAEGSAKAALRLAGGGLGWGQLVEGELAWRRGKRDVALAALRRAVASAPKLATAHAALGDALRATGKLDEAMASYKRALVIAPTYGRAIAGEGRVMWARQQHHPAINHVRRALEARGDDPFLLHMRASVLVDMNRRRDARRDFLAALELRPGAPAVWVEFGQLQELRDNIDSAEKAYRKAIAVAPRWPGAHFQLALCLLHQRKHADALEALAAEAKLGPVTKPDHYRIEMDCLKALGRDDEVPPVQAKLDALLAKQKR